VKIAQERLREAKANHQSAVSQFFPWVSPGITYRQHDDKIQDVSGNIIDVNKYSYAPGATVGVQLDLGDTLFKALASKQLAKAADHALEAQRQDTVLAAAQGYFELALAQGAVGVANEAVRISSDYETQLGSAVEAGIAFKGDLLRARVQAERNRLASRQAKEQQRIAAARLAQVLRLDPVVELVSQNSELVPLTLIETNAALDSLVVQTLASRPELKQSAALTSAARETKNGAAYGPLIPTVGAQGFWGGLGGGRDGISDSYGGQQDYIVGAGWRIGPGGLFDFGRVRSTEARLKIAQLSSDKLRDDITRQVVEAFTRWQSLADQLDTAKRALTAAEEGLLLAQQRKEFAVGIVLETIQAEQDLTRARLDYLKAVAEFNKSQYALKKATGQ
jgi:OMF family outer membrane factor